jgi:hypothetical protein
VKRQLLAVFLLPGLFLSANSTETAEPVSVDAICGKLVSIEDVPDKETTNSLRQEVKPFAHTRIRIFSPTAGADCCGLITAVAEVTTGRDGSFQFKKPTPGDYWLVATIGHAEYKLLVRYQPGMKADTGCSKFMYALEKGKFQFRRTETATVN